MQHSNVKTKEKMHFREQIEDGFEQKAFLRPLFYSYPGGLRFELSESGGAIQQFLQALRKAEEICQDIFPTNASIVVCMRAWRRSSAFDYKDVLSELHAAGIKIPRQRCIWIETVAAPDVIKDGEEEQWLNIAFEGRQDIVSNLLWCALAVDFPAIRPNPGCLVYLFNMQKQVMVFPYDDRGMDVVGSNHDFLAHLYKKHQKYLLDYDRDVMNRTFSVLNSPLHTAPQAGP